MWRRTWDEYVSICSGLNVAMLIGFSVLFCINARWLHFTPSPWVAGWGHQPLVIAASLITVPTAVRWSVGLGSGRVGRGLCGLSIAVLLGLGWAEFARVGVAQAASLWRAEAVSYTYRVMRPEDVVSVRQALGHGCDTGVRIDMDNAWSIEFRCDVPDVVKAELGYGDRITVSGPGGRFGVWARDIGRAN